MGVGLFMLIAVAGPSGGASGDPFETIGVERVAEPRPAPDVAFRTLDGRAADLRELRGRVVLLGFFTTW